MPRPAFWWLNDISRRYLSVDYLLNGQSGEDRVGFVSSAAAKRLGRPEFAEKLYDYVSRGWISFSSPVWSNYGMTRGMPISCFGTYVEDDTRSILRAHVEVGMMSKHGGGTSLFMDPVRPRGSVIRDNGTSLGTLPFAQMFETEIKVISQGSSRRGECATYWGIEHHDLDDVLKIRTPENPFDIYKLSYGVTIPTPWMESMLAGDEAKRTRWAKVVQSRMKTGYPYLIFIDNARKAQPKEYSELGLSINHSNLCTEIFLSNGPQESFVCCLSSMNMFLYDEWKDTDAVETAVYFLDTVMSEFIEKARDEYGFDRAVRFAERQRALGLGQLGWHGYLQANRIPFDSPEANGLAARTSKTIRDQAFSASAKMAAEYGEPMYLKGKGRRHMTMTAIAPNQSSAAILGQMTESTDPLLANFTIKDKQKVKYTYKNPLLLELLAEKGKDAPDVIRSVFDKQGSVQHLDFLTPLEKAVFKTHREINPMSQVQQSAARVPYVCQGQSMNLLVDPNADLKQVNKVYIEAWKLGVKSIYYQKNISAAQELTSCRACEG